jgi:hypothetical protein
MPDFKNPFADPELTYKGKTVRQRAEEIEAEERRQDLEARLEAKGKKKPTRQPPAPARQLPPPVGSGFSIESWADTYRISGVVIDGNEYVVDLGKNLLDGGKSHTQDEWVALTKRLPSAKQYNAIILSLYANKDHANSQQRALVEEAKEMLKQDFVKHYMMTSTRVAYQSAGKDKVIHDLRYAGQHTIDEDVVGPHAWINATSRIENPIKAILGTDNLAEIEQAYEWLSGKKPYLWRLNSKPTQEDMRAVVLGLLDSTIGSASAPTAASTSIGRLVGVTSSGKKFQGGRE